MGSLQRARQCFRVEKDCWNDTNQGNPRDGLARTNGDCSLRVLRGGSCAKYPEYLRSARRYRGSPDNRHNEVGWPVR
jgi:formylglycine-generating enzyme required for sulfatase activity